MQPGSRTVSAFRAMTVWERTLANSEIEEPSRSRRCQGQCQVHHLAFFQETDRTVARTVVDDEQLYLHARVWGGIQSRPRGSRPREFQLGITTATVRTSFTRAKPDS